MQSADPWVAVIIEDEPDVRMLLDTVLTQSGFRTVVTADGPAGIEAVREHQPLLTTLDVNMPGMDGFAVAKRIREFSQTYLIMVTGLADEIDVVSGFEAGADDYLVKPFRPRELRARAESMLRRPRQRAGVGGGEPEGDPAPAAPQSWAEEAVRQLTDAGGVAPIGAAPTGTAPAAPATTHPATAQPAAPPAAQPAAQPAAPVAVPPAAVAAPEPSPLPYTPETQRVPSGGWIRIGELAVNTDQRICQVGQRRVDLSAVEFDLLTSLLMSGRRVRSKADLVLTMRGQNYVTAYFVNEADKQEVEVHIESIRRKLGDDGATPRWIETVRGVGYRLAVAD